MLTRCTSSTKTCCPMEDTICAQLLEVSDLKHFVSTCQVTTCQVLVEWSWQCDLVEASKMQSRELSSCSVVVLLSFNLAVLFILKFGASIF